eukprot:scaffold204796_cov25-Prasinocladus_malaysianus.AAC.1
MRVHRGVVRGGIKRPEQVSETNRRNLEDEHSYAAGHGRLPAGNEIHLGRLREIREPFGGTTEKEEEDFNRLEAKRLLEQYYCSMTESLLSQIDTALMSEAVKCQKKEL